MKINIKKSVLIFLLISLLLISLSCVSANEIDTNTNVSNDDNLKLSNQENNVLGDTNTLNPMYLNETGVVSGDVELISVNPWTTSGSLEYTIPDNVKEIKSAMVIINSYSGSGNADNYALHSQVNLTTTSIKTIGSENLTYSGNQVNDPTVYVINNHTTKQYSDYQYVYDIKNEISNLDVGTTIKIDVVNSKYLSYGFDGRIKMISLFVAYDDDDLDKITYWLNIGQVWSQSYSEIIINTKNYNGSTEDMKLKSIALSSYLAENIKINDDPVDNPAQSSGSYYIYLKWDNITDYFNLGSDTKYSYNANGAGYGSYKTNILLLTAMENAIELPTAETTVKSEYAGTVYAGVVNNLTVTVKNSGVSGEDVVVKVLIGDEVIGSQIIANYESEETYTLNIIDSTIREITENTVNGNNNEKVNYTVVVENNGGIILNQTNTTFSILYNGNLGKDYAYPGANVLLREFVVTGDVIVLTGDNYSAGGVTGRSDVFDVVFDGSIDDALLYVSYNWDKVVSGDFNAWNTTFNGHIITPIASYRDQSNLGNYGKYGYGLVVYNVTEFVVNGENTFVLNKTGGNVAVYPSNLIVLTNNGASLVEKHVYILEEADLLSKSNNKNLNAGFNRTFSVVDGNATLYVFAASAQAGEGNLIINDDNNINVWSGTSSSLEYYIANVTSGNVNVFFESTGTTILGLHQIIVVKNEFVPKIEISSLTTPWSSGIYAATDNNLTIKINNKDSKPINNVTVEVYTNESNKIIATYTFDTLNGGDSSIIIKDPTIRDLTSDTIWPNAQNNKVKYIVNIKYCDINIANKSFDKIVAYNGYLNKTYAYGGSSNKINRNYTISGDIIVSSQPTEVYMDQFSRQRNETWNISIPDNSNLVKAFLYFNYNWDTTFFPTGWNLTFNGNEITDKYIFWDTDQGNLGGWGIYKYGILVFDVSDYFKNGDNIFNITKTGNCALYPSTLIVLYNTTGSKIIKDVYFSDICDVLYSYYNKEYVNKTNVYVPYNGINVNNLENAAWYVFAGSADGKNDGNISFNGKEFTNLWENGTSNSCFVYIADVSDAIGENNDAWYLTNSKLVSTVVVYEQILVVTRAKELPTAETTFKSEYAGTVYAGVVNNLTVTVKNGGKSVENIVVKVLIGDEVIGSQIIANYESGETYTLNIIDSIIREITENTVNGNNNKKVNYTVVVEDGEGILINETNYTFAVLYNGNLGKDYAYPGANVLLREFVVTGDVIVLTGDNYSAGGVTGRSDVFDVVFDGSIGDALLYVSYNWDKVVSGDFNAWNTTFNGHIITPIASYRDQSNLGNYGKYGYGLVVYNVTEFVVNGENTFVLNKTGGNVAVYPSNLIVLTNNGDSLVEKHVYILEEADLLSKSNNKNLNAGFNRTFDVMEGNATLYVFAASAQKGEGNLIINGKTNIDVWNGTGSSLESYITDVDSGIISVYFESISATILGLHQMIVVENNVPIIKDNATILIETSEITEGEDAIVNVSVINATGNVTLSIGNYSETKVLSDSKVMFIVSSLIAGNYIINVNYDGDDKFNEGSNSINLTVNPKAVPKENATMDVHVDNITEGENATIIITLPNDVMGNVTVGDVTVDVVKGTASVIISNLPVGNNTLNISYSGDDKYNSLNSSVVITVNPKSTFIVEALDVEKYYGGSERFRVKVTDLEGNPISGQSVVINIGERQYNKTTNANGTATAPLGLNSGLYNISVKVNDTIVNATALIKSTLEGSDVLMVYRNGSQYLATFKDSEGNYLAEGTSITFNINGVFYDRYVRSNGIARLNLNLEQGNYIITALNTKTGERYANSITILSSIIENRDITKYYRNGTQYSVKVLGKDGNPVGSGANVTFNINGMFYTRTTNNQSVAKMNINLQPGDYVITADYNGCKVSNEITVLPILSANDLNKVYGSPDQFVATLVDGQGKVLAGEKVSFNINGVMYERTTNSNGQAKLNIKLQAGEYIITSSYKGANIANKVTVTA